MLQFDVQKSVGCWIGVASHEYQRAMNQELTPTGITFRQCQVLGWLAVKGPLSQVDLADCMNIEPSTLVRVLDRMERDGLLARHASVQDRRIRVIEPTKKAEPVWKQIIACAERVRARATAGLSAKELKALRETLAKIQANLSGTSAEASPARRRPARVRVNGRA